MKEIEEMIYKKKCSFFLRFHRPPPPLNTKREFFFCLLPLNVLLGRNASISNTSNKTRKAKNTLFFVQFSLLKNSQLAFISKNIATGETSQAITPYHFFNCSYCSLAFINSYPLSFTTSKHDILSKNISNKWKTFPCSS